MIVSSETSGFPRQFIVMSRWPLVMLANPFCTLVSQLIADGAALIALCDAVRRYGHAGASRRTTLGASALG
ncbi:MAG: hypothetical protein ACLP8S_32280 [Solirubrobacteraceae bacterium]